MANTPKSVSKAQLVERIEAEQSALNNQAASGLWSYFAFDEDPDLEKSWSARQRQKYLAEFFSSTKNDRIVELVNVGADLAETGGKRPGLTFACTIDRRGRCVSSTVRRPKDINDFKERLFDTYQQLVRDLSAIRTYVERSGREPKADEVAGEFCHRAIARASTRADWQEIVNWFHAGVLIPTTGKRRKLRADEAAYSWLHEKISNVSHRRLRNLVAQEKVRRQSRQEK